MIRTDEDGRVILGPQTELESAMEKTHQKEQFLQAAVELLDMHRTYYAGFRVGWYAIVTAEDPGERPVIRTLVRTEREALERAGDMTLIAKIGEDGRAIPV